MLASDWHSGSSEFEPLGSEFGLVGRDASCVPWSHGYRNGKVATATDDERLRNSVHGPVIGPEDEGYDEARSIWNGAIDRRPAWIARCTGVADVVAAVHFARERDLLVAVRSGGHGVGGHALCDGGLVIDLSPMKGIRVDPASRTARAEAGVLWGELDRETQLFGLATVGGIVSHTGVAGLTLGGGIGWLMRKHGATVDNLLSVDLVTAEGELVTASEDENPDLFWGVRGGGGTSASSRRSSTACTRSGRSCSRGQSSTASRTRRRYCASTASSRPTRPTSSPRSSSSSWRRHCRSCPRTCTASRSSWWAPATPGRPRTGPRSSGR